MAFVPIVCTPRVRGGDLQRSCRFYVSLGADGRVRITFGFSRALLHALGWRVGDRVIAQVGVGPELGAFLLHRVGGGTHGTRLLPKDAGARAQIAAPENIAGTAVADYMAGLPAPFDMLIQMIDGGLRVTVPHLDDMAHLGRISRPLPNQATLDDAQQLIARRRRQRIEAHQARMRLSIPIASTSRSAAPDRAAHAVVLSNENRPDAHQAGVH